MLLVRYNGIKYSNIKTIEVSTSLDDICSTFNFSIVPKTGLPFGMGDLIVIEANGIDILTGYIESVSGSISADSVTLDFSGRNIWGDLVDSSVPTSVSSISGGIGLKDLCEKVIRALGISGTVSSAENLKKFSEDEITAIGFGGTCGEFLISFARKRQIFLTSFGGTELVLYRPDEAQNIAFTMDEKSLLSRDFAYSDSGRFNTIAVGSEDNLAQSDYSDLNSSINRVITFKDPEIRASRYLQIQAEESMNDSELKGRAEEEVNIRRARSLSYSCTVPSHNYFKGQFISLTDRLAGVSGVFLIRSVTYTSTESGEISNLVLTYPESYTSVGNRTSKRKSKIGSSNFNDTFVKLSSRS